MVEEKICVVEAICEYECIHWERFGVYQAIKTAYNYALRILGYSSRRAVIWICSGPLKTLAPTTFSLPSPSGGVNMPCV